MRLHILGIPHTVTSKDYVACAYTQKIIKLCAMMRKRGHYVIHYGHAASVVDCDEHVTVTTQYDLDVTYPGFDYKRETFRFDVADHAYRTFYANAIEAVRERKRPLDFLLCMWGHGHRPVADAHNDMIVVEPGIGYSGGHFAKWKVFESYALLHAYLGMARVADASSPPNYDVVIPNYFDPADFTFRADKDNYLLCLGRVDRGKGIHVAMEAAGRLGMRLIIAGQGNLTRLSCPIPWCVEYFGHADVEQRRVLLSGARAVLTLSQYVEPFGGVAVEAMMSGTPVIASDWGAFTETVPHGRAGYRVRTFGQLLWAIRNVGRIDPYVCHEWAMNYSCDAIAPMYEDYLDSVLAVYDGRDGWYDPGLEREDIVRVAA